MEAKLNDDLIYAFSKIAIMEYLTSGITSNFDMYISPNPVIQASIDCGFRTVMTGGLNNFTQTVEEIDECYKKYNGYIHVLPGTFRRYGKHCQETSGTCFLS